MLLFTATLPGRWISSDERFVPLAITRGWEGMPRPKAPILLDEDEEKQIAVHYLKFTLNRLMVQRQYVQQQLLAANGRKRMAELAIAALEANPDDPKTQQIAAEVAAMLREAQEGVSPERRRADGR